MLYSDYIRHKGWLIKVPYSFSKASPSDINKVCNGMGPKNFGWLVPDTMYGLNLEAAGDVHDWMYAYPEEWTRGEADEVFKNNMYAIIKQHGGWKWVQWLRKRRALKYYKAVRTYGDKHFSKKGQT